MMAHLMSSLEAGHDIGHYGRLVFAMIARHFMNEDELIGYMTRSPGFDDEQARGLLRQIEARGYNPPKRERILDWMRRQAFPICPEPEDAGQCNVYRNLAFPEEVYERINQFYQGSERS
jgi:DNA primase large subunit